MLDPYRGKHSALLPACNTREDFHQLRAWRSGRDRRRAKVLKELAKYLAKTKVKTVAGPVLSGALFAQALEESSGSNKLVRASYIPKPGYRPEKHTSAARDLIERPWIFVDDIISAGTSLKRSAEVVSSIPAAVIVFTAYSKSLPPLWAGIPVFEILARKAEYWND